MDFDRCKLNNDEFCSMTTTRSLDGSTETEASVYRVTNDGTKLEQKENLEATSIESIDIVELTRNTLRLQWVEDGSTTNLTFEQDIACSLLSYGMLRPFGDPTWQTQLSLLLSSTTGCPLNVAKVRCIATCTYMC